MVFEALDGADKRSVRLVCQHFNTLASETIKALDVCLVKEDGENLKDIAQLLSQVPFPVLCLVFLQRHVQT